MDIILALFYCLFTACIIYPPTEFVTAGFTIPQIFEGLLGSENVNFVDYHMRRTSITMVFHSFLPMGYWLALYFGGWRSEWMLFSLVCCSMFVFMSLYKMMCWWEYEKRGHPVVKTLLPYETQGSDWRVVAADLNNEFKNIDKVSIQLTNTSKFVATPTWFIKVCMYRVDVIRQDECTLVATATDSHSFSVAGEDEVQYINIEAVPTRDDVQGFSFRINTAALRDLQPRLLLPVRMPEHISLQPNLIDRFVNVFLDCVRENPAYIIPENEEVEQCIGCMQEMANVKIERRCLPPPARLIDGPPECQSCQWSCGARFAWLVGGQPEQEIPTWTVGCRVAALALCVARLSACWTCGLQFSSLMRKNCRSRRTFV